MGHIKEGTTLPPWSNNGWVAVKAIPVEMVDGSGAEGLRECLSTFKDLNRTHVVRYERFWLEKLEHLPPAVCEFVESRTGVKTAKSLRCTDESNRKGGAESALVTSMQSMRFCCGSASTLTSHPRFSLCTDSYCGFAVDYASPTVEEPSKPHLAVPAQRSGVLLIEMEMMVSLSQEVTAPHKLTLRSWLQCSRRTFLDAADVFGQLIMGVRHIHRKRIVHADLKPDNIFCVQDHQRVTSVRIGDFGLAGENQLFRQFSYGKRRSWTTSGTPGYIAPEICGPKRVCPTDKVDIYACAVIFLELLSPPFQTHMGRVVALERLRNEQAVPDFVHARLPKTCALLVGMADPDPAARLSAEEICKQFRTVVRKELSRMKVQMCCSPRAPEHVEHQGCKQTLAQSKTPPSGTIKGTAHKLANCPEHFARRRARKRRGHQ